MPRTTSRSHFATLRRLLIVAGALVLLAACSASAGATPSPAPTPSSPAQLAGAPATPPEPVESIIESIVGDVCSGVPQVAVGNQTNSDNQALCAKGPIGVLPAADKTPSIRILVPTNDTTLRTGEDFEVVVGFKNFEPGHFDDPNTLYGLRPFSVNAKGHAQGHSHVYVQRLEPDMVPDASQEVDAFLALNEPAFDQDGNQISGDVMLYGVVPAISEAGDYRVCADIAGANHLAFPKGVARNGLQADCIQVRFE